MLSCMCSGSREVTGSTCEQEMRNPASAGKSSEGFVQWRDHSASKSRNSAGAATCQSGSEQPQRRIPNSPSGRTIPQGRSSVSRGGEHVPEVLHRSNESRGGKLQNLALSAENAKIDEETEGGTIGARKRVLSNAEVVVQNVARRDRIASLVGRVEPSWNDTSLSTVPTTITTSSRMVREGRRVFRESTNSSISANTHREVVKQRAIASSVQEHALQNSEGPSSSWKRRTDTVPRSVGTLLKTTTMGNEHEVEADEEYDEHGQEDCLNEDLQVRFSPEGYTFYNDELDGDASMDRSDEGEEADAVHEGVDEENVMAVVDWEVADESAKRKERRQAQAAREREGDRRRKEGLRRNYLMVDEYTHKPYGPGVGEWRKEIMLLSQMLDPAIGNINRQPEGAVAEIADWIQHTWEYSSPVKFEFVKEVVARGVTQRRVDMWNKIRNNEDRPEKISDRSWRSLQRQLESPATIKKSENCSRANAARVNFGRTGPSGEVGVRERLRRRLRRSPEPEEIQREMSRDKGYGGRSRRNSKHLSVMHGSKEQSRIGMQLQRINEPIEKGDRNIVAARDGGGQEYNIGIEKNGDMHYVGESSEGRNREGVMNLSAEEISHHPLVLKMIERLEALERQKTDELISTDARDTEKITTEKVNIEQGKDGRQQGDADGMEIEERNVPRKPGRPRKKVRND